MDQPEEEESTTTIPVTKAAYEELAKTTEATVSKDQELILPVPTAINQVITTLKNLMDYTAKLAEAPITKVNDEAPPASFVNYTVSRSLEVLEDIKKSVQDETKEETDEDEKKLQKRSVDLKQFYVKNSAKEKGCSVGGSFYKPGEEIKTDNRCLECLCYYSPIGHCTKKDKCAT